MTATVFYEDPNEIALLTNTFLNSSGTPADPTTVTCTVTDPSGTQVIHTYGGASPADIMKPLVGKYTLAVPCLPAITGIDGLWAYEWTGTGLVSDVQPGTWRVLSPALNTYIGYCGLEELKDRLGITDTTDDYAAQLAIQAASSWVTDYTGVPFNRVTETRTFVPHDIWQLIIDPLVSITSLAVDTDGDGTFDQAWVQNVDYQLKLGDDLYNINAAGVQRPYKKVQVLQAGKWFPFIYPYSHLDRVQITGTWGWPSVPPPVAQATLMLAARLFKSKDAPFGVAGVSDFGVVRIQTDPWLTELLRPYTNQKRKVGV